MKRLEIERLLPGVFQRAAGDGTPIAALLDAMEALHAPSQTALERLDENLDPRRASESFLPLLASWVNLNFPVSSGPGRLRELIAAAAELSRWRGTRKGLLRFLELATGVTGFKLDEHVMDEQGKVRAFHVRVQAPAAIRAHRPMLERIIEREKPAHVTYELAFV